MWLCFPEFETQAKECIAGINTLQPVSFDYLWHSNKSRWMMEAPSCGGRGLDWIGEVSAGCVSHGNALGHRVGDLLCMQQYSGLGQGPGLSHWKILGNKTYLAGYACKHFGPGLQKWQFN